MTPDTVMWISLAVLGGAVIALAGMGAIIAMLIYSFNRAKLEQTDPRRFQPGEEDLNAEVVRLRGRVATLERLAVDEGRRAADGARLKAVETHPAA